MTDIELVIKIPEEAYKDIQSRDWKNGELVFSKEWKAIHSGTPLPKGHGRLIDADELKKTIKENDALAMSGFSVRLCDINSAQTIIEADKAESEPQESEG